MRLRDVRLKPWQAFIAYALGGYSTMAFSYWWAKISPATFVTWWPKSAEGSWEIIWLATLAFDGWMTGKLIKKWMRRRAAAKTTVVA